jgi:heavy-metal-associated domain-containing protein
VTAPLARVVHSIPGRARLRASEIKGDERALEALRSALEDTPGVQNVQVSARTGSLLLEYQGSIEAVLDEAERRGHLRVDDVQPEPYLAQLHRALGESDQRLRYVSRGKLDLETLSFMGFVAGGVYQVFNGHGLPAGVTMLRYAVELVTSTAVEQVRSAVAKLPDNGAPKT